MILAHKIALDPAPEQAVYFARAAGTARFAWNWALGRWQEEYALWKEYQYGPKPSEASLRRELNALKDDAFPWMREVTKNAPQQAIKNLGTAFKNFFEGRTKYPRFKRKGVSHDSFRADPGPDKLHLNAVEVDGKRIKLPVIGWVKMREVVRFAGKIKSAIVSRTADRWFVSLSIEVDHTIPVGETQVAGGVDLGVKALATLSDGTTIEGPKALRRNLKMLRRRSRAYSRKVKGSANRRKSAARLARLHARIANVRQDALHKATTRIVEQFDVIGIEDLNVRGMMANGKLSRAVADVGMFEFRRQIEYKAAMSGARIVVANRWYPSSKTCSDCGCIHTSLTLSDREWTCDDCGVIHDRDHNAAINLMNMAGSSSVTACGAGRAGLSLAVKTKRTAAKQEPTHGIFAHV
jgi:putative transposase